MTTGLPGGPVAVAGTADGATAGAVTSETAGAATHDAVARVRAWLTPRHALQVLLRLGVPLAIFGRYLSFAYLRPTNAARMLVGDDWVTYLVSPNFLRGAPLLTAPLAGIPRYVAPVGAGLAKTDALPVLAPVYRLLLVAFPDKPIQLLGWILLAGIVGTFNAVARFCDRVRCDLGWPTREGLTLALAATAVIAPFWTLQYVHPALMQQWILVWALTGALARCPTFLRGRFEPARRPDRVGLGPIFLAAAVQPYLIPMVALPALAPDLARLRREPLAVVRKAVFAVLGVVVIAVALGYLGGGKLGSTGFGAYAGDLATAIDPDSRSRFVNDVPSTPDAIGGYGYLGLGGIVLVATGVMGARLARRDRRQATGTATTAPMVEGDRLPLRLLQVAVLAATVYAVAPVLRVFGRPVFHIDALTDRFSSLTALFRVNGRFVWVLLWAVLLVGAAHLLLQHRRRAIALGAAVLLLQVADVVPWPRLLRPPESVEYAAAVDGLRREAAAGATAVRFEPPVVIPGCYAPDHGSFADMGDAILAAAVAGLSVNSGYTARLEPEYVDRICGQDAADFAAGRFEPDVVYLLPTAAPAPAGLRCTPLTTRLTACRTQP